MNETKGLIEWVVSWFESFSEQPRCSLVLCELILEKPHGGGAENLEVAQRVEPGSLSSIDLERMEGRRFSRFCQLRHYNEWRFVYKQVTGNHQICLVFKRRLILSHLKGLSRWRKSISPQMAHRLPFPGVAAPEHGLGICAERNLNRMNTERGVREWHESFRSRRGVTEARFPKSSVPSHASKRTQ
jgi:hypothetical protein